MLCPSLTPTSHKIQICDGILTSWKESHGAAHSTSLETCNAFPSKFLAILFMGLTRVLAVWHATRGSAGRRKPEVPPYPQTTASVPCVPINCSLHHRSRSTWRTILKTKQATVHVTGLQAAFSNLSDIYIANTGYCDNFNITKFMTHLRPTLLHNVAKRCATWSTHKNKLFNSTYMKTYPHAESSSSWIEFHCYVNNLTYNFCWQDTTLTSA